VSSTTPNTKNAKNTKKKLDIGAIRKLHNLNPKKGKLKPQQHGSPDE
jgi:hypothetical protein